MILPPRTTERVLESLGADADYREAVLGDLAEEFALRVERDGVRAARWWYVREAIRATPHLLHSWARRQRVRDVAHLAGVVLTANVLIFTLSRLVLGPLILAIKSAIGVHSLLSVALRFSWGNELLLAIGVLGPTLYGFAGGYIAAWLGIRAPIVSAVALGVHFGFSNLVMLAISGAPTPVLLVSLLRDVLILVCATLGGICCVRVASRLEGAPLDVHR